MASRYESLFLIVILLLTNTRSGSLPGRWQWLLVSVDTDASQINVILGIMTLILITVDVVLARFERHSLPR